MYLDNAATTPLKQEVKDYIISILDDYGNPSSHYSLGDTARKIINQSRENVAKFINAKSGDNIIFTSSGSASNTLAIKGLEKQKYLFYYSPIAHKSMIKTCESTPYHRYLKVNQYGELDLNNLIKELERSKDFSTALCIDMANSEIGIIQDIEEIIKTVHKYNGIVICDATGYIPSFKIDVQKLNIDILTFSAHKLGALKGTGVLYKRNGIKLDPLIYGSQEQGLFAGTENVIGIAALGKAIENYDYSSVTSIDRDYVYNYLINNIPDSYLIGKIEDRLPHNLYMCFKGVEGESLMLLLDLCNIQVSTGSACNSGNPNPSATLVAIDIPDEDIHSCIRITLSGNETKQDLDYVCNKIRLCVEQLRNFNR